MTDHPQESIISPVGTGNTEPFPELEFHPIADDLPLLEGPELDDLAADIAAHGQREDIVLYESKVIDGRNRYRACMKAGIKPRCRDYDAAIDGPNPLAFVLSLNVFRRHLTTSQRAYWGAIIANRSRTDTLMQGARSAILPNGKISQAEAARMVNVSERAVRQAKVVRKHGVPELLRAVERGDLTVSAAEPISQQPAALQRETLGLPKGDIIKVANETRQSNQKRKGGKPTTTKKNERPVTPAPRNADSSVPITDRHSLIYGNLNKLLEQPADSVDIICTEPPHRKEDLPLFIELGKIAQHLLKLGGWLLCFIGQLHLKDVLMSVDCSGFGSYHWMLAVLPIEVKSPVQARLRHVNSEWQPVLAYCKGVYDGPSFSDVIRGTEGDPSGTAELLNRFVKPGDVVCDPFVTDASSAVASLRLGAKLFIGRADDAAVIDAAKARIANAGPVGMDQAGEERVLVCYEPRPPDVPQRPVVCTISRS